MAAAKVHREGVAMARDQCLHCDAPRPVSCPTCVDRSQCQGAPLRDYAERLCGLMSATWNGTVHRTCTGRLTLVGGLSAGPVGLHRCVSAASQGFLRAPRHGYRLECCHPSFLKLVQLMFHNVTRLNAKCKASAAAWGNVLLNTLWPSLVHNTVGSYARRSPVS